MESGTSMYMYILCVSDGNIMYVCTVHICIVQYLKVRTTCALSLCRVEISTLKNVYYYFVVIEPKLLRMGVWGRKKRRKTIKSVDGAGDKFLFFFNFFQRFFRQILLILAYHILHVLHAHACHNIHTYMYRYNN